LYLRPEPLQQGSLRPSFPPKLGSTVSAELLIIWFPYKRLFRPCRRITHRSESEHNSAYATGIASISLSPRGLTCQASRLIWFSHKSSAPDKLSAGLLCPDDRKTIQRPCLLFPHVCGGFCVCHNLTRRQKIIYIIFPLPCKLRIHGKFNHCGSPPFALLFLPTAKARRRRLRRGLLTATFPPLRLGD